MRSISQFPPSCNVLPPSAAAEPKEQADAIIAARYIVTVREGATTAAECVLLDHALVVNGGRIIAVLPKDEALRQFHTEEFVDMPESALMPGLVNMHSHLGMTLLRGFADDLCLSDWLMHHIWPAEGKCVGVATVSSRLC